MTHLDVSPSALLGDAYANDRARVFHSWSAQGALDPTVIAGALGSKFWNEEGTTWIDFTSMLVNMNLGHQHPKMIQAIKDQVDVLCMVAPPFANDQRSEAARLIVDKANRDGVGGHFEKVFFTNAGAEAVENAVRLAKGYTGRMKVLSAYRSYHGGTALTVGLTGEPRRLENEPSVPGLVKFWGPYPYRSAFHSESPEQETERALQHLRETILVEGADKIAAILLESVVGTNGILVPPPGYLEGLRALCDEFGIVWIADEVMAGFGRTGQWFALAELGRATRPDRLRQGCQLRVRPAGWRGDLLRHRPRLRHPRVPGRAHLLGAPAGVLHGRGQHRHLRRGGRARPRPPPR